MCSVVRSFYANFPYIRVLGREGKDNIDGIFIEFPSAMKD